MAEETKISWADHTFNPWVGCTRISPACDSCYAAFMMEERYKRVKWGGPGAGEGTRDRTSASNWMKPIAWNKKAEAADSRPFVFCSSLADVFDNAVPVEWRKDLFELIIKTPNLVWLLLTKRPQNILKMFAQMGYSLDQWPANAAIGTTVEDQRRAIQNIPHLLEAKNKLSPAFAFLSSEPLLGDLDLEYPKEIWPDGPPMCCSGQMCGCMGRPIEPPLMWGLDWVITGGETDQGSRKARPTHPDHFRKLRDQCAAYDIPFHFKQWGNWASVSEIAGPGIHHQFPDGATVRRVPKDAEPTLDGVYHKHFPTLRLHK